MSHKVSPVITFINTSFREYREYTYHIDGCITPIVWEPRERKNRDIDLSLTLVRSNFRKNEPPVTLLLPRPLHIILRIRYSANHEEIDEWAQQYRSAPYSFFIDCPLLHIFFDHVPPVCPTNYEWGSGIREVFELFGYTLTIVHENYAYQSNQDFHKEFNRWSSEELEPYLFLRGIKEIPYIYAPKKLQPSNSKEMLIHGKAP